MRVFLTKPDVVLQQHIGSVNGVSPLDEKRLWERLLRSNIHIGWRIRFDCKNRHVLKQQSDLFWSFTVYFSFFALGIVGQSLTQTVCHLHQDIGGGLPQSILNLHPNLHVHMVWKDLQHHCPGAVGHTAVVHIPCTIQTYTPKLGGKCYHSAWISLYKKQDSVTLLFL